MVERVSGDDRRINPWSAYEGYDWGGAPHSTSVRPGVPPGPHFDTQETMKPLDGSFTARKTETSAIRSSNGGPRLSPPKVTADIGTKEWYAQMGTLATASATSEVILPVDHDDYHLLRAFFDICEVRKGEREDTQRMGVDSLMKNRDIHKTLKKEMDDSAEKSKSLGFYSWAMNGISTFLKGTLLVLGGITLFAAGSEMAVGGFLAAVTATGVTRNYVQAALSLATAFATASKGMIDKKTNEHKKDQEAIKFKIDQTKQKRSSDLNRIKKAEEGHIEDVKQRKQLVQNHGEAVRGIFRK